MRYLEYSIKRISSVLDQIIRLEQIEFPYKSSFQALKIIEDQFRDHYNILKETASKSPPVKPKIVIQHCGLSLYDIHIYLPILGFILNSTSVQNAFETYGPLQRLSHRILSPTHKLIISSEWDNIPYVFCPLRILPDFVMIGLPAQESENPLLLPLAGHELGHWVWSLENVGVKFQEKIENIVLDKILNKYWDKIRQAFPKSAGIKKEKLKKDLAGQEILSKAYDYASRQSEEIFCDFVGLKLFAESYLDSMCYMLSPYVPGVRSLDHPNRKARMKHLLSGAKAYSIKVSKGYLANFQDSAEPREKNTVILINIADDTSSEMVNDLISEAQRLIQKKGIQERSHEEVDRHVEDIKKVLPISGARSLSDIMNAGWKCYHEKDLWPELRTEEHKDRLLKELVLKSIEVFEIEERLRKRIRTKK